MKAKILVINIFVFWVQESKISNLTLTVFGMWQEYKAGGLFGANMTKIFPVYKISYVPHC